MLKQEENLLEAKEKYSMSEEKSKEYWKNYQEHEPQKPLDDKGLPLSEGRKPQTPPPPPPVVKVKKEKGNE